MPQQTGGLKAVLPLHFAAQYNGEPRVRGLNGNINSWLDDLP
jgi:hypothetical protein